MFSGLTELLIILIIFHKIKKILSNRLLIILILSKAIRKLPLVISIIKHT